MAQIIEIKRVRVGLEDLTARVRIVEGAPLMTSEDLVATTRIYYLMPHIVEHVCMGDRGETFKDAMGDTEVAHLLEHMTVELLSQSSASSAITSGRTYPVEGDERSFDIELSCPDDVLVMGALSSAVWIANWAFGGGEEPQPDVSAIVGGLTNMVDSIGEIHEQTYRQQVEEELQAEVNAEYQRMLKEREEEIAKREEEIAAVKAEVRAEAEAARKAAEEEARRIAEEKEAARKAAMPSWVVDLDEYERQQDARRKEEEAAAEAEREAQRARQEAERRRQEAERRRQAEQKYEEDRRRQEDWERRRQAERGRTDQTDPDEHQQDASEDRVKYEQGADKQDAAGAEPDAVSASSEFASAVRYDRREPDRTDRMEPAPDPKHAAGVSDEVAGRSHIGASDEAGTSGHQDGEDELEPAVSAAHVAVRDDESDVPDSEHSARLGDVFKSRPRVSARHRARTSVSDDTHLAHEGHSGREAEAIYEEATAIYEEATAIYERAVERSSALESGGGGLRRSQEPPETDSIPLAEWEAVSDDESSESSGDDEDVTVADSDEGGVDDDANETSAPAYEEYIPGPHRVR